MDWKKIRVRYCTIKAIISGAKNDQEILSNINSYPEFRPVKSKRWEVDELIMLIRASIIQLKNERIAKTRDIYNTVTNARRIELFVNPDWIAKTRNFSKEKKRIKDLELAAKKAKEEEERRRIDAEEKERSAAQEKERRAREEREREIAKERERVIKQEKEKNQIESVFKNILTVIIAIAGFVAIIYGLKFVLDIIAAIGRLVEAILFNPVTIGIGIVILVIHLFRKS